MVENLSDPPSTAHQFTTQPILNTVKVQNLHMALSPYEANLPSLLGLPDVLGGWHWHHPSQWCLDSLLKPITEKILLKFSSQQQRFASPTLAHPTNIAYYFRNSTSTSYDRHQLYLFLGFLASVSFFSVLLVAWVSNLNVLGEPGSTLVLGKLEHGIIKFFPQLDALGSNLVDSLTDLGVGSEDTTGFVSVRAFPVFVINARGSDGQLLDGFKSVGLLSGHDVGYKEETSKGGGWTLKSS
jgi:hypothetical protein